MKHYLRIRCPFLGIVLRQYVVQATSEHEAIAKFWVHEFRSMHSLTDEQLDRLIGGMVFNVAMAYEIHQGRLSEAREVRSAPALALLDDRHRGFVLRAIAAMFEPFEVQQWLTEE